VKILVTDPVYEAMEFEAIVRPNAGDDISRKVYAIRGRPGVYSRISADVAIKDGKLVPGVFRTKFGDATYFLRVCVDLDAELKAAGYLRAGEGQKSANPEEEEAAKE